MGVQNQLLDVLPGACESVRQACELVELKRGCVLSEPGEVIRAVFFPTGCVVSLIAKLSSRATLEVALVGSEGMVGLPILYSAESEPLRALVQRSGEAWRMDAQSFRLTAETNIAWRRALNGYAMVRFAQLAQNSACTQMHPAEARLARRLLTMQDKANAHEFDLTQAYLAQMLGVQRPTVTLAAISFQRRKIIRYKRGVLTILDRKALQKLSCECYGVLADQIPAA